MSFSFFRQNRIASNNKRLAKLSKISGTVSITQPHQTLVGLEDVLKKFGRHVLNTSWRPLKVILKMSWRDVLKTSSRRLEEVWKTRIEDLLKTCAENVLRKFLEDVLKTLWRKTKYFLGTSASNKSKCASNKSIFHKYISGKSKANLKCINKNLIISVLVLFWNSSTISILRLKRLMTAWCCKISWIQIWHCRTGEAIKSSF